MDKTSSLVLAQSAAAPRPPAIPVPAPAENAPVPASAVLGRIHGHLRGRYHLAVPLALLLAAAGAWIGWQQTVPLYKSEGLVRFTPAVPGILYGGGNTNSNVLDPYLESQISIMRSRPVIDEVTAATGLPSDVLLRKLDITHPQRSELININGTDENPKTAAAMVQALITSYLKVQEATGGAKRIAALEARDGELEKEWKAIRARISAIAHPFGTDDLRQAYQAQIAKVSQIEALLRDTTTKLITAEIAIGRGVVRDVGKLSIHAIATLDDIMKGYVKDRHVVQMEIEQLRHQIKGSDHPPLIAARAKLNLLDKSIRERAVEFRKLQETEWANLRDVEAPPTAAAVEGLRTQQTKFDEIYQKDLARAVEIGRAAHKVDDLAAEAKLLSDRREENKRLINQLRLDSSVVGQIDVISHGDLPGAPSKDRRTMFAAAGAGGGLALGLGVPLVFGLLRGRLRYSADLVALSGGVPMVGVLPRVSKGLVKWGRSAPAAYVVHRLRTLLQTGPDTEARRVLAVTSPSSGDGKTSLTLSLGLSYAGAGQRTLLIDFDFLGRNLSLRMGRFNRRLLGSLLVERGLISLSRLDEALAASRAAGKRLGETLVEAQAINRIDLAAALAEQERATLGLSDVLAGEPLQDCVAETGIRNLWVLPMGSTINQNPATPAAVRRLIDQAAEQFDIVFIDTGAVIGSLETLLACREADGVVLTVSRGGRGPATSECLEQLRRIEARVVGTVFNRARGKELAWVRRTPLFRNGGPSGPSAPQLNLGHLGPLPAAVAGTPMPWGAVRPALRSLPAGRAT